ncbi:MAG: hydrogenase nickel incorporation protein HypB [Thermoflexales bacterium]|nr:hydrogenase nickel incorporation protein HypB [Thermoflexales bacterium]
MSHIPVIANILESNQAVARDVRRTLGGRRLVLNLISSPGAGKTTLVERTAAALKGELQLAVIEGDMATSLDAERVAAHGVPVVQINTGGGCHLEARQVAAALAQLPLDGVDVLIIENVGNLVCPTSFDLGEDAKIIVASLAEGDDKPLKYPAAFIAARLVLVNKIDLAPYLPVDVRKLRQAITAINAEAAILEVSCTTGQGLDAWLDWIRTALHAKRGAPPYSLLPTP